MEEESTRAPVNSQWLIAHTYKRSSSHRYIYPWRFHVGKKSFFLGSSNAQGTGFHRSSSPPLPPYASFLSRLFLARFSSSSLVFMATRRSRVLQVSNEKGLQHTAWRTAARNLPRRVYALGYTSILLRHVQDRQEIFTFFFLSLFALTPSCIASMQSSRIESALNWTSQVISIDKIIAPLRRLILLLRLIYMQIGLTG